MTLTTDPNDPRLGHGSDEEKVPQQEAYLILSKEERDSGFIRPLRRSYTHVGKGLDLSKMIPIDDYFEANKSEYDEERIRKHKEEWGYIGFIKNEDKDSPIVGRFVSKGDLISGCGTTTTMSLEIAETYARDPKFYGSTYCLHCGKHRPVEEFVWAGSEDRVGS